MLSAIRLMLAQRALGSTPTLAAQTLNALGWVIEAIKGLVCLFKAHWGPQSSKTDRLARVTKNNSGKAAWRGPSRKPLVALRVRRPCP